MAAVATSSVSAVSLCLAQASSSSSFNGKSVVSLARLPAVTRCARLVVQAQQGNVEKQTLQVAVSSAVKSVLGEQSCRRLQHVSFIAMNAMLAMPALAEEKGKIFDFNLTLPIIVVEFLLLMTALDKIWFKPVAEVMDARDENIRSKLAGLRDNSGEIKALQLEAEAVLKAARFETAEELKKTKKETAAALDAQLQEAKTKVENELAAALANLESKKEDTLRGLDVQIKALSEEIISKVVPFKI
eukprot:jgi/Mesen1/10014/ME000722S09290